MCLILGQIAACNVYNEEHTSAMFKLFSFSNAYPSIKNDKLMEKYVVNTPIEYAKNALKATFHS